MGLRKTAQVTIASGASLSAAVSLGDNTLVAIQMPSGWDAASITFQGSHNGETWNDVYDAGTELSLTVAASRYQILDPAKLRGLRFLKLRSGATGEAVNQTADRVLNLISHPVA
jgi:hypothetical protein